MPTLLQINVTANWGSTGKIAEAIGRVAMKRGWKSYIAYGRYYKESKSILIKVGSKKDTYLHYLKNRVLDGEGLASCGATEELVQQIDRLKPDVVQLHNIHDHYLNYRILFEYLNQTSIKVVWTFHDCWSFTGHCYHFVEVNCMRWQSHCHDCPQKKWLVDKSMRNFDLKKKYFVANESLIIVPCSNWMAGLVKQSFLKNKDIKVIHNGIDLSVFRPVSGSKVYHKKFRIIAVSNVWLSYKGINDIYKLREFLPVDSYEITIVGLSKKQVRSLPKGINGVTRTQNLGELVRLYSESDVLINPTYADTFPTVNLESLACGTPVITYKTGGSPEAIDENTGVIVEQGNVNALVEAILNMRENPLSSAACRERAKEYFDKEKCFDKYLDIYENLI